MSDLGTFSPQCEAVRLIRGPAGWARNVAPDMAVYGNGDVNSRVGIESGITPAATAEDIELRICPFLVEAEQFVERVTICRDRMRVERIVDPHDDVVVGGAGYPTQVHMSKFRDGYGRNRLVGGVLPAAILICVPSRRACRTPGQEVEQPVLNKH